jgi:cell division protein FtsQ
VGGEAKGKERMNRRTRPRPRPRPKQHNILHSVPASKHSRKQIAQMAGWCALVLAMIVVIGAGLHFGIAFALDHVLYNNPRYALKEIVVEPRDRFSPRLIREAAGLEPGMNLWALNLHQIAHDLEAIPNVASARVERHFPDRVNITITERVPVVKIEGLNIDLNTKETFYLDRDCYVIKPRADEPPTSLPQIVGLTDAEVEPGTKLDRPTLSHALQILDGINNSELRTVIDVTRIDLSNPLSITMETHQGMTIIFRQDYIDQQLQRLQQIVEYADKQQQPLQSVDLRPDYNVPITFCRNQ